MLHDGNRAAAEFRKLIDHRGLVVNFPWGALARLGLARTHALEAGVGAGLVPAQGHPQGAPLQQDARAANQDFLALWKDADPDVPILKEARAESKTAIPVTRSLFPNWMTIFCKWLRAPLPSRGSTFAPRLSARI